jgi:hypothetical protein
MKTYIYNFMQQPIGDIFYNLLDYGITNCDKAILVVKNKNNLSNQGKKVLSILDDFLIEKKDMSEWPGTILYNSVALVYKYTYNTDFVKHIKKLSSSLYDWQQPDHPDDLSLIRPDLSPWLISTSHEYDSYLMMSSEEYKRLINWFPYFGFILKIIQN